MRIFSLTNQRVEIKLKQEKKKRNSKVERINKFIYNPIKTPLLIFLYLSFHRLTEFCFTN